MFGSKLETPSSSIDMPLGRKAEALEAGMYMHISGPVTPFIPAIQSSNPPRRMGEVRVTKFEDASPFLYAQGEAERQRATVTATRVRRTGLIAGLDRDRLRRLGIDC
jgi:hypothetical protein